VAIYHLSAQIISRSSGRSSVAASAYRSAEKLYDDRTGTTHDYTKRECEIESQIYAPEYTPDWVYDRQTLWNEVEKNEKRIDSQTAREINVALPLELTPFDNKELLKNFVDNNFVSSGMVADVAIHWDVLNPHAHIMLTTRNIDSDGFTNKNRDWNNKELLEQWRENWAEQANESFRQANIEERISHLSLEDQGIDRIPQIHLGVAVKAMEDKGIQTDRGDIYREIEESNNKLTELENNIGTLEKESENLNLDIKSNDFDYELESSLAYEVQPDEEQAEPVEQEQLNTNTTIDVDMNVQHMMFVYQEENRLEEQNKKEKLAENEQVQDKTQQENLGDQSIDELTAYQTDQQVNSLENINIQVEEPKYIDLTTESENLQIDSIEQKSEEETTQDTFDTNTSVKEKQLPDDYIHIDPEWLSVENQLTAAIDATKENAANFEQMKDYLEKYYYVDMQITETEISFRHPESDEFVKGKDLGENYTKEAIENEFRRQAQNQQQSEQCGQQDSGEVFAECGRELSGNSIERESSDPTHISINRTNKQDNLVNERESITAKTRDARQQEHNRDIISKFERENSLDPGRSGSRQQLPAYEDRTIGTESDGQNRPNLEEGNRDARRNESRNRTEQKSEAKNNNLSDSNRTNSSIDFGNYLDALTKQNKETEHAKEKTEKVNEQERDDDWGDWGDDER